MSPKYVCRQKLPLPLQGGGLGWGCFFGVFALFLSACAGVGDITKQPPRLEPVSFSDMPGWGNDTLDGFDVAARRSCAALVKRDRAAPMRPRGTAGDFMPFCTALASATDAATTRAAIETYLTPWRVRVRGADDGLFTGYYEASVNASRTPHDAYQIPIRARPLDHVTVDVGAFRDDLAGVRLTGQLTGVPGGYTLRPYPDRAGIEDGKIPSAADHIIAWGDDAADVFFMEIQGSGRLMMDDGSEMQVSYAERNGQKYVPIGKVLVDRGILTKENTSMQSIRAWMAENPTLARDLMRENPSYIFFRDVTESGGPVGAAGIPLTPMRSVAVDPAFWSYGLPMYVDAAGPDPAMPTPRFQQVLVAQDTGGAIRGAIRGDVFWGAGDTAAHNAGLMKSRGDMWVLLPRAQ